MFADDPSRGGVLSLRMSASLDPDQPNILRHATGATKKASVTSNFRRGRRAATSDLATLVLAAGPCQGRCKGLALLAHRLFQPEAQMRRGSREAALRHCRSGQFGWLRRSQRAAESRRCVAVALGATVTLVSHVSTMLCKFTLEWHIQCCTAICRLHPLRSHACR